MLKPHLEIFDKKRLEVFKKLPLVTQDAILIGGTALALQIGHRKSYDFDLAMEKPIEKLLLRKINQVFSNYKIKPKIDMPNELTVEFGKDIKVTYFHFPFPNLHLLIKIDLLNLYSLEDIASAKAHTIGRRGEWRDYVDMYFLLDKEGVDVEAVIREAKKRFKGEFNEKLFWEQLVYWDDIGDFEIDYIGKLVSKKAIQEYFRNLVKTKFSN